MKKKLIGILVMVLFLSTAIMPTTAFDYNSTIKTNLIHFTISHDIADNLHIYEKTNINTPQIFVVTSNHPPIYIESNDNFTLENGVVGGSGTENDPYIIENWIIVGDNITENGIFIKETDVFFVIRNCSFSGFDGRFFSGVRFEYVINGRIEDVDSFNNYNSISLRHCSYIDIDNSKFFENIGEYASGVKCYRCNNIEVVSCEIYNMNGRYPFGIRLFETGHCLIENCNISNSNLGIDAWSDNEDYPTEYNIVRNCKVFDGEYGIGFLTHYTSLKIDELGGHNSISNCEVYNNYMGIVLANNPYNIIEDCNVYNNEENGIELAGCSYTTLRNIYIHNNMNGLSVIGELFFGGISKENRIEHCDIYENSIGMIISAFSPIDIVYNNINNNKGGILVFSFIFGVARINHNNIYDNYFDDNGTIRDMGLYSGRTFTDARDNWWGSEKGPSTWLFKDRGNSLINILGIVLFRPWATSPISSAGVQE